MAEISLPLPGNVLHSTPQTLEFEKVATFIGGNGSGKSTILKSIFDEKLKPGSTLYQSYKIVCFSSGQNESYSFDFSRYLTEERSKRNALNLDCFYYDKSWSKLLIFLATCTKSDGLVRTFLRQNGYVTESDLDEDQSTELSFNVKVDKAYTNLVQQSLEDENNGEQNVFTNRAYHRTLYNFINAIVHQEDDYNFESPIEQQRVEFKQETLSRISFETDQQESFDSMVMFFTQAADNDYFVVKNSFELSFSASDGRLNLEDLSDGEYQILFLFSLLDLFDSENTLFLFDEADSHLHYRNIDRLWDVFEYISGRVITTTHLLDSIAKSGIGRLRVIERGEVKSEAKLQYIASRLRDLSKISNTKFQALSLFPNVVLIDDENDWEIFKLLALRKLATQEDQEYEIKNKLKNFIAVKCESSYQSRDEDFGFSKLRYLNSFASYLDGHAHNTKNVFLVCDRDELPLASIGTDECSLLLQGENGTRSFNRGQLNSHLLSWRRREIKHYLISATAMDEDIGTLNRIFNLGPLSQLSRGNSGDTDTSGMFNSQLACLPSETVKGLVEKYIDVEDIGFCSAKAKAYISKIPRDEISEDIVCLYEYLVGNNNG